MPPARLSPAPTLPTPASSRPRRLGKERVLPAQSTGQWPVTAEFPALLSYSLPLTWRPLLLPVPLPGTGLFPITPRVVCRSGGLTPQALFHLGSHVCPAKTRA